MGGHHSGFWPFEARDLRNIRCKIVNKQRHVREFFLLPIYLSTSNPPQIWPKFPGVFLEWGKSNQVQVVLDENSSGRSRKKVKRKETRTKKKELFPVKTATRASVKNCLKSSYTRLYPTNTVEQIYLMFCIVIVFIWKGSVVPRAISERQRTKQLKRVL